MPLLKQCIRRGDAAVLQYYQRLQLRADIDAYRQWQWHHGRLRRVDDVMMSLNEGAILRFSIEKRWMNYRIIGGRAYF